VAGDRQGRRFVAGPRVEVDLDEAERLTAEATARLAGEPALALAAAEPAHALAAAEPALALAAAEPALALAAAERALTLLGRGPSWPMSPTPTGPSLPAARPSS
jgi:hypothetical protein